MMLTVKQLYHYEVEGCDAPTWRVWDTRLLLQKEMEEGTAYQ